MPDIDGTGAASHTEDVTGRDDYLISQAVATTYALTGTLPEKCQATSNRHDLGRLLRHWLGPDWKAEANRIRQPFPEAEWRDGRAPLAPDVFEGEDGAAA